MISPRIAATVRPIITGLSLCMGLVRSTVDHFYPWDRRPCPPWATTREAGKYGERIAAHFLRRAGVKILVANYRARCGEIDLVARHGRELVMIEVKTRRLGARLAPQHAVTWSKQRRMIATTNRYLGELGGRPPPVRFDIVEVLFAPGELPQCRWLPHAFTLQEAGLEWSR